MRLAVIINFTFFWCLLGHAEVKHGGITLSAIPKIAYDSLDYASGASKVKILSEQNYEMSFLVRQRNENMTSRYLKFTFGKLQYQTAENSIVQQDSQYLAGISAGVTSDSRKRLVFDLGLNYSQQFFIDSLTARTVLVKKYWIPSAEAKISLAIFTPSNGRGKIVNSLAPSADTSKLRLEFKAAVTPPIRIKSQAFTEWSPLLTERLVIGNSIRYFALFYSQQFQATKTATYKRNTLGFEISFSLDFDRVTRTQTRW